jgi:AcrR family transcriptional regulator
MIYFLNREAGNAAGSLFRSGREPVDDMAKIATKNDIKKEKKRNDLLKAAYELFTTVGFSKTTILNIALKAGVGKGTFYLYFNSKEEIRDTLIIQKSSEVLQQAVDRLEKTIKRSGEDMSLCDKVIFVTDFILNYLSKDIALLKFISKHLSWGLLANSAVFDSEDGLDFKTFVSDLMDRDKVDVDQPALLIFTIIELVNSTCYNVILRGEPVSFSDYKPYLYRIIRLIVNDSVREEKTADQK